MQQGHRIALCRRIVTYADGVVMYRFDIMASAVCQQEVGYLMGVVRQGACQGIHSAFRRLHRDGISSTGDFAHKVFVFEPCAVEEVGFQGAADSINR